MIFLNKKLIKENIYLYLFGGFCGALAESFAAMHGAWSYTIPNFIGIPFWLPLLWGIAALFVKNAYLRILNLNKI